MYAPETTRCLFNIAILKFTKKSATCWFWYPKEHSSCLKIVSLNYARPFWKQFNNLSGHLTIPTRRPSIGSQYAGVLLTRISFFSKIIPVIMEMRALWLVEACVISRHNHFAQGDYSTGAEFQNGCLAFWSDRRDWRKIQFPRVQRCY